VEQVGCIRGAHDWSHLFRCRLGSGENRQDARKNAKVARKKLTALGGLAVF